MFGGTHPRAIGPALRAGLAAVGVGAVVAAYAGTAYAAPADKESDQPGVTAAAEAVTGVPATKIIGKVFDASDEEEAIGRISIALSTNETVLTYCIDIKTQLQTGEKYVEGDWEKANPGSDMPHILWVLDHSMPNVPTAQLLLAAGAVIPPDPSNPSRQDDVAYMATQAAVWHFSDNFTLGSKHDGMTDAEFAGAQKVYDYLTGAANTGMSEPAPSLEITPQSLKGEVGKPIGPFLVKTTATSITLTPSDGAKIVDADGNAVNAAKDGDKFSVVIDKPGKATVSATGSGTVPAGRIFVFQQNAGKGQKLVIASPSKVEVSANVSVSAEVAPSPTQTPTPTPSASPSPQAAPVLANTGASPWPKVALGIGLLAVGTALTVLARRRRSA